MALILYFLLVVVSVFILVAVGPLIAKAYHDAKEEIAAGGAIAALGVLVRGILWILLAVIAVWLSLLGGMFL